MALISVSNNALSGITALPASIPTGALTLIKSITASASASISFVDGTDGVVLDGTYSSYIFKFIDINPATDNVQFEFNMSTDSGSNYNVVKTSTYFVAYHAESDSASGLVYETSNDLAQSTNFQWLSYGVGNGADESTAGTLQIFNPSSTTFVKHYISRFSDYQRTDFIRDEYVAGYGNTVSAVDAVRFQFSAGNIDDGIIKLYGVS